MSRSTDSPKSFASRYGVKHNIAESDFTRLIVLKSLHAPLRWIAPLFLTHAPRYFEADYELVRFCGRIVRLRGFDGDAREFSVDPRNRGFWRGLMRQRISTQRLRKIVRETLKS